jgi:MFS family permease
MKSFNAFTPKRSSFCREKRTPTDTTRLCFEIDGLTLIDTFATLPTFLPMFSPGYYYNRVNVVSAGCVVWGLMTALFGLSPSLGFGGVVWAVNGIGLALLIPNSFSLIADFYPDH